MGLSRDLKAWAKLKTPKENSGPQGRLLMPSTAYYADGIDGILYLDMGMTITSTLSGFIYHIIWTKFISPNQNL